MVGCLNRKSEANQPNGTIPLENGALSPLSPSCIDKAIAHGDLRMWIAFPLAASEASIVRRILTVA
jgi:hypothetical protein